MNIPPGVQNGPEHPVVFRRTVALEQQVERGVHRPAPRWRWPQLVFAWIGLAVGYVCLVVPGLLMRPHYRAWRAGERPTPGIAGPVGALVVWGTIAATIAALTSFDVLAFVIFVFGLLPSLAVSARG